MKNIYKYALIASAVFSFAACNDMIESSELAVDIERTIILTATREGTDPNTRSVRMEDGSTWWGPKEEISVFYGSGANGGSKFTSNNTTLAETTEFEGSISMSGNKEFWAVYPYSAENSCDGSSIVTVIPSRQTGSEGNFSDDVFPAIGKSNSLTMAFWNICGGIKFFVSRTDIQSVTIKGNNGETLAGKVKVAFNAGGKPEMTEVLDGQTEVTLIAPDDGCFKPGKYYYITLLPIALDGGITLTFYTSSEKGEIVSDKAQTVKRSIFGVLKNIDAKVSEWESTVAEPEWVDLGLSVKWATFNVGASKPEEYGDYFAWGETEPYYSSQDPLTWKDGRSSGYDWASYKWCNGSSRTLTKYNTSSSYGTVDNKTVLDIEDDAAHVNWGGSWRMPTRSEIEELENIDNCLWTWTSVNGIKGYSVTSKKNGNCIFLPAAGSRHKTESQSGSSGSYWSSSISSYAPYIARKISFYSDHIISESFFDRFSGYTVRPVYGIFVPVSSITLNETSLYLEIGYSVQLAATITPSYASDKSVWWESQDENIASIDKNGNLIANAEGTTVVTAHSSNGLSAKCAVTVTQATAEPEAVDLGLSVKWATMNVGATKPEESGEFFAWGETEPKTEYTWSTYKWCNGSNKKLTKYCPKQCINYWDGDGEPDGLKQLELDDDAAHVNWGGSWRIPTMNEVTELIENCNCQETSINGVHGLLLTSKLTGYTHKTIFLPLTGYRDEEFHEGLCYYWNSASLSTTDNRPFVSSWGYSSQKYMSTFASNSRCVGHLIRAVTK